MVAPGIQGISLQNLCLFAIRWHNSGFSRFLGDGVSDIHVLGLGLGGVFLHSFYPPFQFPVPVKFWKTFATPVAGRYILLVGCRPRQMKMRVDVDVLVSIIQ